MGCNQLEDTGRVVVILSANVLSSMRRISNNKEVILTKTSNELRRCKFAEEEGKGGESYVVCHHTDVVEPVQGLNVDTSIPVEKKLPALLEFPDKLHQI